MVIDVHIGVPCMVLYTRYIYHGIILDSKCLTIQRYGLVDPQSQSMKVSHFPIQLRDNIEYQTSSQNQRRGIRRGVTHESVILNRILHDKAYCMYTVQK